MFKRDDGIKNYLYFNNIEDGQEIPRLRRNNEKYKLPLAIGPIKNSLRNLNKN